MCAFLHSAFAQTRDYSIYNNTCTHCLSYDTLRVTKGGGGGVTFNFRQPHRVTWERREGRTEGKGGGRGAVGGLGWGA